MARDDRRNDRGRSRAPAGRERERDRKPAPREREREPARGAPASARSREIARGADARGREALERTRRETGADRSEARERRPAISTGSKSRFVYTPPSDDQMKKRAEGRSRRYDSMLKEDFPLWKPEQGDNYFRVLPPTFEPNPNSHFAMEIFVHWQIGPNTSNYVCPKRHLNKRCPICEAEIEARKAGMEEEAKDLSAKNSFIAWIIDRDDPDNKPQIWQFSYKMNRNIGSLTWDKRTGKAVYIEDPDNGYDLSFVRNGSGKNTEYIGLQVARDESSLHEDQQTQEELIDYVVENPLHEVLNFYDADHLEAVVAGSLADPDPALDDPTEDRRGSRSRDDRRAAPARGRGRDPDPQEDPEDPADNEYYDESGEDQGGEDPDGDPGEDPEDPPFEEDPPREIRGRSNGRGRDREPAPRGRERPAARPSARERDRDTGRSRR